MAKKIEKNKKQVITYEKKWAKIGMGAVFLISVLIVLILFWADRKIRKGETTSKIGFVTDFEYGYKDKIGAKLTNRAPEELRKVVDYYNNVFRPDLVISGGDMVESSLAKKYTTLNQFREINAIFSQLSMRREYVLGNHDLRNLNKEEVRNMLGMDANHKYFDLGDWRIVLMDTNFDGRGTDMGPASYVSGRISDDEFTWLREALTTDRPAILFSHHPPFPEIAKNVMNGKRLISFLEEFQNLVLVVSGHDPDYKFNHVNGINYLIVDNLANIDSVGSFATLETKFNKYTKEAKINIEHFGPNRHNFSINKVIGEPNLGGILADLNFNVF